MLDIGVLLGAIPINISTPVNQFEFFLVILYLESCLPVHFSTVAMRATSTIIDRVDDSVIADSNSVAVSSLQLEKSSRRGSFSKAE